MNTVGHPFFHYQNGTLYTEGVPLPQVAQDYGTPVYVYSKAALQSNLQEFQETLNTHPAGKNSLVCYAVKANSNLAILNMFARMGAGFDIVSGGELERALAAGAEPEKIVFSGVGKTENEIQAALQAGILCFNVESAAELERINQIAGKAGKIAPISLRVNPDVDPKTHPYISTGLKTAKFGVPIQDALELYVRANKLPHLKVTGIDCHIGSQLLDPSPFLEALERILELYDQLTAQNITIQHLDIGGGLGIKYQQGETQPSVRGYLIPLLDRLAGRNLKVIMEPGRRLVGNAGVLLTKVEYLKPASEKNFALIDAAMNDLMRPALYEAWHDIIEVDITASGNKSIYDVVGPVCETGDFLGQQRELAITPGALLAVMSAGAYGMAMSSNYNTRPKAAEVIVDGKECHCIRRREHVAELYAHEQILPE